MTYHALPTPGDDDPGARIPRRYAWVVFALSFGLLLSDYMSRQVLNAVFPLLKAEWALTDTQLGSLSGIVALMVGLLTFPLSLLADRFGRVRSLTLMATVWSLATLGCGPARTGRPAATTGTSTRPPSARRRRSANRAAHRTAPTPA